MMGFALVRLGILGCFRRGRGDNKIILPLTFPISAGPGESNPKEKNQTSQQQKRQLPKFQGQVSMRNIRQN